MSNTEPSSRIEALRRSGLLDSEPEETFDRLTRLASTFLQAPIALVSLVDEDRQFFKSAVGLPVPIAAARCTPLEYSFCRHVVASGQPLVVDDAREHSLVKDNPAIRELGLLAYLGIPLLTDEQHALGTLCVLDTVPRRWTAEQVSVMLDLAEAATTEITLRRELAERARLEQERGALLDQLRLERDRIGTLFEQAPAFIAWGRGPEHRFEGANRAYYQLVGHRDIIGRTVAEVLPEVVEQGLVAALDAVLESGEPFVANGMRLLLQRTPGAALDERFVNFVYQPLVEADGTRSGIFCHGVDVTTQVRAEMALRESEAHHRLVLDSLPVIVYRAEPVFPYPPIYVSAAIETLGYTREEWLAGGGMWDSRLHPEDRARVRREALNCLTHAKPKDDRYRMIARNGSVRWFHDRGEFVPDDRGDRCVWQGIMLDITAQCEAEEALRANEARTRMLIETAHEGIWLIDERGVTTYANARLCSMLGYSAEELLGRSFFDFMTPDAAVEARAHMARRQGGSSEIHECGLQRRDGSERFVLMATSPMAESDGAFSGALVMVTDISARRAAEEALRVSESRYRHVVANTPGMVYQLVHSPDGTRAFTFVSEGARGIFGVEPDAALRDPQSLFGLVHPDEVAGMEQAERFAAMTTRDFRWEGRAVIASGEERFVQIAARQQRTPDGGVVSDGLVVDITERQHAARRLEESEQRFRLAARATRDVLYDWDIARNSVVRGEALQSAFGYEQLAVNESFEWWAARVHPADLPRVTSSLGAMFAGRAEAWSEEYRFRRNDKSYADILDRGYVLRDEHGKAVRMVGCITDLTAHHQLEEQYRQSQKLEAIGRLAGGVAHDFNNILTVITASSGFLLEDLDMADPRREEARQISDASDRAAGLTRQLLAFSRKQVLEPRVLSLNQVVEDMRPMLSRLIGEDIVIDARLAEPLGTVMADAGQLEMVLMNLVVNARDAMPGGGRITIETAEVTFGEHDGAGLSRSQCCAPGTYVLLRVRDTGVGMSTEVRERAFEPFYTTKEPGQGTGLGLATVYGIVKQSEGHIMVHSEPGEGTTFEIYLSRLAAPALPLPRASAAAAPGSETILLVEDEDVLRGLTRRILERHGYRVLEGRNGKEALAWVAAYEGDIDIVLTDVVMPELGGLGLVERLTALRPGVAVIYMSGFSDDHVTRSGMLEGKWKFIQKPFSAAQLLSVIRDAVAT